MRFRTLSFDQCFWVVLLTTILLNLHQCAVTQNFIMFLASGLPFENLHQSEWSDHQICQLGSLAINEPERRIQQCSFVDNKSSCFAMSSNQPKWNFKISWKRSSVHAGFERQRNAFIGFLKRCINLIGEKSRALVKGLIEKMEWNRMWCIAHLWGFVENKNVFVKKPLMCSRFLYNEGFVKFQVQILIQVRDTRRLLVLDSSWTRRLMDKQVTEHSRESSFEAKSYRIP